MKYLLIIPLIILLSCEADKTECFTFQIEQHHRVICDDEVIEDYMICAYKESICGITESEAIAYAKANSQPSEIFDYEVRGCISCDEITIFETKQTTIIW